MVVVNRAWRRGENRSRKRSRSASPRLWSSRCRSDDFCLLLPSSCCICLPAFNLLLRERVSPT